MYDFKYGLLPTNESDRKYCQLKGDAGLYEVSSIDHANKMITLGNLARIGEQQPLSKIRFVSNERYMHQEAVCKEYMASLSRDLIPGKTLFSVDVKNGSIKLREVLTPFGELGYMTINHLTMYAVTIEDHNGHDILTKVTAVGNYEFGKATLKVARLSDESSFTDLMNEALFIIYGVRIGYACTYFNPLTSVADENVIVTNIDKSGVTICNITKDMKMGKKEKTLRNEEHFYLEPDYALTDEYEFCNPKGNQITSDDNKVILNLLERNKEIFEAINVQFSTQYGTEPEHFWISRYPLELDNPTKSYNGAMVTCKLVAKPDEDSSKANTFNLEFSVELKLYLNKELQKTIKLDTVNNPAYLMRQIADIGLDINVVSVDNLAKLLLKFSKVMTDLK